MGAFKSTLLGVFALALTVFLANFLFGTTPKQPKITNGWFGRGPNKPDSDRSIVPFTIDVPNEVLDDLQGRLENARLGEDLEDVQFQYGFQVNYMKEVLEHWKNNYDWREQEKQLNQFSHFKTNIEGIDIHFIHVKPKNPTGKPRPLLLTHGWPGSVWEFYKILPMLTDPAAYGGNDDDAFEVICPSIPGYGFSEAAHQTGMNAMSAGRIFVKLMERLGHKTFYLQGGDWGALISTCIAQAYPLNVRGIHLNMITPPKSGGEMIMKQIVGNFFPSLLGISDWEYKLNFPLNKFFVRLLAVTGYMHLQATKPDTVAFGLNDSPVGLAAYILEKFGAWTNLEKHLLSLDGAITEKFTMDELLTNVMIYWVTGSIGSSMRFYRENIAGSEEMDAWDMVPVTVPAGLAGFPNDLVVSPRTLCEIRFKDIKQYTMMSHGGHFAAMEEPRLLADDLFAFVKKVEQE